MCTRNSAETVFQPDVFGGSKDEKDFMRNIPYEEDALTLHTVTKFLYGPDTRQPTPDWPARAGLYVIVPVYYGTRYTVTVYVLRHMYTLYVETGNVFR